MGFGEGGLEVAVEGLAPGVHFGPGHLAGFDGEEAVAVGLDADGDAGFAQGGGAGEEEAEQMHGMLPADFAVVAEVLFDFLELGQGVAVEGLEDHLAEEAGAEGEEFFAERGDFLNEGRVEAFQDVGIGFEGHGEEFLEFPVAALGGVVLELFGRAVEGPLEVGGGEVDAAQVGVRVCSGQAVGAGADDAAVEDAGFEVEGGRGGQGPIANVR